MAAAGTARRACFRTKICGNGSGGGPLPSQVTSHCLCNWFPAKRGSSIDTHIGSFLRQNLSTQPCQFTSSNRIQGPFGAPRPYGCQQQHDFASHAARRFSVREIAQDLRTSLHGKQRGAVSSIDIAVATTSWPVGVNLPVMRRIGKERETLGANAGLREVSSKEGCKLSAQKHPHLSLSLSKIGGPFHCADCSRKPRAGFDIAHQRPFRDPL